jgi:tRNA A-37 threonylcarbamoyl transferase component Bud32
LNRERWRRINDIFHTALEHDTTTREAYVREATAGDPELFQEVETLLATHQESPDILEKPAWMIEPELAMGHDDSLVHKQVGQYRILEEVGRGGMGIVYAATDTLGRTVAMKALPPEYTRDPVRRKRLMREAVSAASVQHPAIATVFALDEIDGEMYIISELVRGRTLRQELRDGPVPPDQLLPTLIAIAEALSAAHAKDIVHRDLKPENIMRREDGQIKVLDFGLARPAVQGESTSLTVEGTVLGTPGYMAPEQLTPGARIDGRTDIFALGVIAWELATGEHPLGTNPASIIAKMTDLLEGQTPALSRALPLPGLDRVVRRCMRRAPADRYPSAEAVLVALYHLKGGRSLPMSPVRHDSFWWWQGHQLIVSALNAAAAAAVWSVRQWIGKPGGTILFLASLALATVSVALRLNLFFASRVHPLTLLEHRARVFPPVAILDTLLAAMLLAAATIIAAADHDGMAAILIALAAVMLASLSLIEPATTAAAGLTRPDSAKKTPTTVR